MQKIASLDEIKENRYFILKHSNTCPISRSAYNSTAAAAEAIEAPFYLVVVQENRELSNTIANTFGITHESPQLLLVANGTVVWHDSHYGISKSSINDAAQHHLV